MAITSNQSLHCRLLQQCLRHVWSPKGCGQRSVSSSATFQLKPFKLHKLEESPKTEVTLEREDALNYYRQMMMIRRMEAAANALYKEKSIRGFCHLYSGQEAVAVGIHNSIRYDDQLLTFNSNNRLLLIQCPEPLMRSLLPIGPTAGHISGVFHWSVSSQS